MKDFGDLKSLRDQLKEDDACAPSRKPSAKSASASRANARSSSAAPWMASRRCRSRTATSIARCRKPCCASTRPGASSRRKKTTPWCCSSRSPTASTSKACSMTIRRSATPRTASAPTSSRSCASATGRVQDELDLHGMTRDTARGEVGDFVRRCVRRGVRCVRIIHGVGYGSPNGEPVLRAVVHSWLVQLDDVVAFCVASRDRRRQWRADRAVAACARPLSSSIQHPHHYHCRSAMLAKRQHGRRHCKIAQPPPAPAPTIREAH